MWNDTEVPTAIFFTFRCYGTWLHGDERTSVDRHHNGYGTRRIPAIEHLEAISKDRMLYQPVKLDSSRRRSVEKAIRETCKRRRWGLNAIHVRTNHAHVVASIGRTDPDVALGVLKANATRQMREDGCWTDDHSPWAKKGSCRRLWNEKHVSAAEDYVNYGQGRDLPKFD